VSSKGLTTIAATGTAAFTCFFIERVITQPNPQSCKLNSLPDQTCGRRDVSKTLSVIFAAVSNQ
jgi:hypothetical protein